MERTRALVVADAAEDRELVSKLLRDEGFAVETAGADDAAVAAVADFAPTVIVIDLSHRELIARIGALLRPHDAPSRRVGRVTIDTAAREVRVGGRVVELTRIEFDLLDALSTRPRVTLTRRELLDRVWGPNWFGDDHVVAVHVSKLRRKLGSEGGAMVRTVRGVGYRLDVP